MFRAVGVVSEDELINGYRRFGQRLEGHPTPILPWVDVATGSLGQGLPDGVGVALAGKYLDKLPYRIWVLCGDSELAEGSIWEALDKASHYQLSNMIIMMDINRLGQSGPTDLGWDIEAYAARAAAFGARVIAIDGHDLADIDAAFSAAEAATAGDQPTVILAKTIKGKGFSEVENKEGWHGLPFPPDMAERAIAELGGVRNLIVRGPLPEPAAGADAGAAAAAPAGATLPDYAVGDKVATRKAYGDALVALGASDPKVVALDGEVKNSTFALEFATAYPERYFEMFIAEQQMVAAATGLAVRGYKPFASTFAAFFTRAYDFIRMGAISGGDVRLAGLARGVEIGADGPSQMALEDLAMMRAVHGSTVLYPADGTSTAGAGQGDGRHAGHQLHAHHPRRLPRPVPVGGNLPAWAAPRCSAPASRTRLPWSAPASRCTSAWAPPISWPRRASPSGSSTVTRSSRSTSPTLTAAAQATGGWIVVAEDHHPEGGLGAAVARRAGRGRAAEPDAQPTSPSGRCPAPGPVPNCSPGPASTPSTSPRPPVS